LGTSLLQRDAEEAAAEQGKAGVRRAEKDVASPLELKIGHVWTLTGRRVNSNLLKL